jgi:hypothetical protein
MSTTIFIQQFPEIFEKLHMPPLVGRKRYGLHIFFNCRFRNFMNASVVAKMNDFCSPGLQNPAHNIDGSIMTVEE